MNRLDEISAVEEIERLRKELAGVKGQLEKTNSEMEEFVSMAAHNLLQSVRDVTLFTELIAENYSTRLDGDGGAFLQRVQEGAAAMQLLLADVVDYWAIGSTEGPSRRTEMEDVLRQALLCADKQITERSAVVTHDPLPPVSGNFEMLTKVLHHLIRNAVEYCTLSSPRIHVSANRAGDNWVISVADNGPGIEPCFQSRIFLAFRRLQGKEFPGSGLGLAFCRKAIERQGGRMWMESQIAAGSTFFFALPAAE